MSAPQEAHLRALVATDHDPRAPDRRQVWLVRLSDVAACYEQPDAAVAAVLRALLLTDEQMTRAGPRACFLAECMWGWDG